MIRVAEPSHRIAAQALGALKKRALAATPRNFETWYAHFEGKSPALSRDIQKCLDEGKTITQTQADKLFDTHIRRADLPGDVMDIVARFETELAEFSDILETTGENALWRGDTLQRLSAQLHQAAEDYPGVGALLESILTVAKSVRQENFELEQRLAESSSEVVSLRHTAEHIQQAVMTDPLTNVKNRKSFDMAVAKMTRRAQQMNEPFALILGDIDHFKQFNDRWGHQSGDEVLRLVAEVMDANVKGQDLLARYGGEEFGVLLPNTSLENAAMLAERIRCAIESRRLKKRRTDEDLGRITMSMGVAVYRQGDTAETVIERADERLYAAKRAGRNRVVCEAAGQKLGAPPIRSVG